MKFMFKKDKKETGLSSVGYPYPKTRIKHNKKDVGYIDPPTWRTKSNEWKIYLAIIKQDILEDGNPNCEWRWVSLKKRFKTEPEARLFIKSHLAEILTRNNIELYHFIEMV